MRPWALGYWRWLGSRSWSWASGRSSWPTCWRRRRSGRICWGVSPGRISDPVSPPRTLKPAKAPFGKRHPPDPDQLRPREALFVLQFVASGNATQSYLDAGYVCARASAEASCHRLLGRVRVQRAIASARERQLVHARMNGEQAMRRASIIADLDVRRLYDKDGRILPIQDWPEDIARAVISIEEKTEGTKVTFERRLGAITLIAESAGEIKKRAIDASVESFDHVGYLADKSRPKEPAGK